MIDEIVFLLFDRKRIFNCKRQIKEGEGDKMDECCINCAYSKVMADELMCDCEESEGYGLSITDDDYCGCFERKEDD